MHATDSKDWPSVLEQAVKNLNATHHPKLGGLRPCDLTSKESAVQIDAKIGFPKEPKFEDHKKNEIEFEKNTDLNVGDYVRRVANERVRARDYQVTSKTLA